MTKSAVDRLLIGATVVAILFAFVWYAWEVLLVTFAGILLAIFLRGITTWVAARTPFNVGWAYTLVLIVLVGLIFLACWLVAPRAISELSQIGKTIPKAITLARKDLDQYDWGRQVVNFVQHAGNGLQVGSILKSLTSDLENAITGTIVILVVGFFVALQPSLYQNGLISLFPAEERARARAVFGNLGYTLHWWILGQLVPMVVLGAFSMVGLWLLGVPLAFTLGLFTGVMIFVPYIGALLSEIPAALVALVQGPDKMIEVIILYLAVHIFEGYILTPWVQRKAVRLPPALTIVAQLVMFKLTGILGVIVATPLAAVCLSLTQTLYLNKEPKAQLQQFSAKRG